VALTRVVLLGLDGFPARAISPGLTPHLWALAGAGGRAPDGGLAPLPSSTYPGFASLLTGVEPAQHGVLTTTRQEGAVPGWAGATSVAAPTLFERCEAAGLRTAAVLGDHLLYGVLRAEAASDAWPPAGQPGGGIPRDAHGYPVNSEVRPHLLATAPDPRFDFVFAHLNEADTLGHDLGPDHPETVRCYAATDAIAGALIAALASRWDETVVVVVSDHDMEPRSPNPPVDFAASPDLAGLVLDTVFDGGAAWVLARPGAAGRVREIVEGLAGIDACFVDGDRLLAVARRGWRFRPGPVRERISRRRRRHRDRRCRRRGTSSGTGRRWQHRNATAAIDRLGADDSRSPRCPTRGSRWGVAHGTLDLTHA